MIQSIEFVERDIKFIKIYRYCFIGTFYLYKNGVWDSCYAFYDKTVIFNENYETVCDKNDYKGNVVYYIRNDLSYVLNYFLPNEIKDITCVTFKHETDRNRNYLSRYFESFGFHLQKLNTNNLQIYFWHSVSIDECITITRKSIKYRTHVI